MESVASEKVETPEPAGADERQDSPQTEENDAPWRRSNVRPGQPAMVSGIRPVYTPILLADTLSQYTSLYRSGDSVYWCPDGRRRKQEGPYKVIAVSAGARGSIYTLDIKGRKQASIPETHLIPAS